jgi:hypothetical protein
MTRTTILAAARRIGSFALPVWFALWTAADWSHRFGDIFASDTRIYYRATVAWLQGGDPWSAAVGPFHFAGLPPTVQVFVPFTWLPEEPAVWLGFAIGVVSAIAIIRALRLPWWWLLFPPLTHGVIVANPHIWLLALLLAGRPAADVLASLLKIYAIVPVFGRFQWRSVLLTVLFLGVSVVLAPALWSTYLGEFSMTQARLSAEAAGGFSAAIVPILIVPMACVMLALAIVDRTAASWLAVPALWPASQFFTQTFALPVLAARSSMWFAALLAIPSRGVVPIAISLYVVSRLWAVRGQEIKADLVPAQLHWPRRSSRA